MNATIRDFLVAHPAIHRIVHRWTARGGTHQLPDGSTQFPTCIIDRIVWASLMREPHFSESVYRGVADFDEGRTIRYVRRDGRFVNEQTGEPLA